MGTLLDCRPDWCNRSEPRCLACPLTAEQRAEQDAAIDAVAEPWTRNPGALFLWDLYLTER